MKNSTNGEPALTRRTWLATAAMTTAATLCNFSSRTPARADEPAPDLTDAQRQPLRAVMNEAISRGMISGGSLLVLKRGKVVFREAFGVTDLESRRPFTTEAPCFIASLTKSITATLLVMLDERGVISLDDTVEKYLPEFKGVRVKGQSVPATPPRIWQLLSHRSGLPGNADMGSERPGHTRPSLDDSPVAIPGVTLAKVVSGFAQDGLLAEPGARFAYGSAGYMVAARIAEIVTEKRYERLLQEWLLDPLRMTLTTFRPDEETLRRVPGRYSRTNTGLQRDSLFMPVPGPDGLVNPAGGLFSTLDDMALFLALHLNRGMASGKQLVSAQSLARMYRPHPPRTGPSANGGEADGGYGLGWNVISDAGEVRHLGGSGTMEWVDLPRQNAGVLLTQVKWGNNKQLIPRVMKEVQALFPLPAGSAKAGAGKK